MRVHGPRDVPELRHHLFKQWTERGGFYGIRQVNTDGDSFHDLGGGDWDARILVMADNFYVSGDMCDVLAVAEKQLPDTTVLTPEMMPSPNGLVVFEKRLMGIDAEIGETVPSVDAILWGQIQIIDVNGNAVCNGTGICSYRYVDPDNLHDLDFYALIAHTRLGLDNETEIDKTTLEEWVRTRNAPAWVALGRSDWVIDKPVDHRHLRLDSDVQFDSMMEDRRRMASLWLLMNDAKIADVATSHGNRAEQRRAERAKQPPPKVRVVDIARKRVYTKSTDATEPKYHINVRSLVSGHWRNQYHPKCERCAQRHRGCGAHPRWINAFWRGPEDGPISGTEKVRVWR